MTISVKSHLKPAVADVSRATAGDASPLLEVRSLVKTFGGVRACDDLSLTLGSGRSLCLIGPNGCGKTTLLRLISGEIDADRGSIVFDGYDVSGLEPDRISRLGIGRKFQNPSVIESLSVEDNVALAVQAPIGHADGEGILQLARAQTDRRGLFEGSIFSGLEESRHRPAGSLSHGERQWLEIAMLLCQKPKLLLLDEPTAGLTRKETAETAVYLKSLIAEQNHSVIVIEHDLNFVAELDIETAAMLRGRIHQRGRFAEIRDDPTVRRVYLGNKA